MSTPKFCTDCGEPLGGGSKFCPNCGCPLQPLAPKAPKLATKSDTPKGAQAIPASQLAAPKEAPRTPDVAPTPAQAAPKPAPKKEGADPYVDPIAAMLAGGDSDDDDLDDHLAMPDGDPLTPTNGGLPIGTIAVALFFAVLIGLGAFIASDEELSARFECNFLGHRGKCVTEEDRLYEIDQQQRKEDLALMAHHYGDFDLNFTPFEQVAFTLKQVRFEESREDFVKRVREGLDDARVRKAVKTGEYSTGKSREGILKGRIVFKKNAANPVTFQPEEGKNLVLPLSLADLPLLEREQVDGNGKRLSAQDVEKLEKKRNNPEHDAEGNIIEGPELKVKTVAVSTWIYEIELSAPGYEPRRILFYEPPLPPGYDAKKLEADGVTARAFKFRPHDGKYVVPNASFDLLPKPKTIQTRYLQVLKELQCMRKSKEYQGKSEQGKKDAEQLIWEQKAFSEEKIAIAKVNDTDPEFIKLRDDALKAYTCPAPVTQ